LQKAFFGERGTERAAPAPHQLNHSGAATAPETSSEPISIPERLGAVILIVASLIIGLYPRVLLDLIVPSFSSPLFDGLRKVGGM
jgi:NADH-quinone oxidoreductase subunit M